MTSFELDKELNKIKVSIESIADMLVSTNNHLLKLSTQQLFMIKELKDRIGNEESKTNDSHSNS